MSTQSHWKKNNETKCIPCNQTASDFSNHFIFQLALFKTDRTTINFDDDKNIDSKDLHSLGMLI